MTDPGLRSRRDLIATVTGGALLGALWGAAFPIVATERRPTIAVVGHHGAQVIMIDTSSARVLLLNGEPDADLIDTLPAIMTVFRQRIDLIVGTPSVLAKHAGPLQERWRIRQAIALAGTIANPPLPLPSIVVDDAVNVALDDRTTLGIRMGYRDQWRSSEPGAGASSWCATLASRAGNIVIAPDVGSVAAIGPPASTLLIAPDAIPSHLLRISPAGAMAVNYDSDSIRTPPKSGPALTRIYPVDVSRFVIEDGAVVLPEWTEVFKDSEPR